MHQNIELILAHRSKHVLVLAGDHIYKMDYGPMIAYHVEKGADITVGVVEVPAAESRHYGVLTATEWNRVTKFSENPRTRTRCRAARHHPRQHGIYVFNTQLPQSMLAADAAKRRLRARLQQEHPAGNHQRQPPGVFTARREDARAELLARRRPSAYYDANVELVRVGPESTSTTRDWLSDLQVQRPPASSSSMRAAGAAWRSTPGCPAAASSRGVGASRCFSDVREGAQASTAQ